MVESAEKILVTGGAGYIGSHMVRFLIDAGYSPVVFDNLSTGHQEFLLDGVPFIKGDLRETGDLEKVFSLSPFAAVIHFAGAALVEESVVDPDKYFQNNVVGSRHLVQACLKHGLKNFIFSSTCAVYGENMNEKIKETLPLAPKNPYGMTKKMVEDMLIDAGAASGLRYVILRYFNACGAHASGEIGEWHDPETHLIPNIFRSVLAGRELTVFGDHYSTRDGTCVRDYIHLDDLCAGHLSALGLLLKGGAPGIYNLGTAHGASVQEVIAAVEKVIARKVRYQIGPPRSGDPAFLVADASKAFREMGWAAKKTLHDAIESSWKWEQNLSSRLG
jgi:UDP-glucose 4-epimerase